MEGPGEVFGREILTVEWDEGVEESFEIEKVSGRRSSVRYKTGKETPMSKGTPPKYLAVHLLDDVQKALGSIEQSKPFTV